MFEALRTLPGSFAVYDYLPNYLKSTGNIILYYL